MSAIATHELKTWPAMFEAIWVGDKTFEVRFDDRGYQKGDELDLREWDPHATCACDGRRHTADCARYSGRRIFAEVGFVTASTPARGQQRGFHGNGYVVLALVDIERVEEDTAPKSQTGIARVAAASGLGREAAR